jgi:Leucine-rich repeat (LRR) protein
MKIKCAVCIIIYFLCNACLIYAYDYLPDGYIGISGKTNTQLKVSTKSCPVKDIDEPVAIPAHILDFMPGYIKPSNDSTYLKSIKGIVIENAKINKIDDSFFELRNGDTLDAFDIDKTNFDYDNLINQIIKNKIKLKYLGISLEYLDSFPKNINKIEGLKKLYVDFMKKNIDIDYKLYNSENIEILIINRMNKIKSNENISKLKNLKELSIHNSDSVYISDELKRNENLSKITITSCKLIGNSIKNINNLKQLEFLNLENCGISDGVLNLLNFKNLTFLNLRSNKFTKIPEDILYLDKLRFLLFEGNYIKSFPFDEMLKLPKRMNILQLGLSIMNFDSDFTQTFESNEKLLQSQGYTFLTTKNPYHTYIK